MNFEQCMYFTPLDVCMETHILRGTVNSLNFTSTPRSLAYLSMTRLFYSYAVINEIARKPFPAYISFFILFPKNKFSFKGSPSIALNCCTLMACEDDTQLFSLNLHTWSFPCHCFPNDIPPRFSKPFNNKMLPLKNTFFLNSLSLSLSLLNELSNWPFA